MQGELCNFGFSGDTGQERIRCGGRTVIDMPLAQKTAGQASISKRWAPGTCGQKGEDGKENRKTGHRRPSPWVCLISWTSGTQTNMTYDAEPLKHC